MKCNPYPKHECNRTRTHSHFLKMISLLITTGGGLSSMFILKFHFGKIKNFPL